MKTLVAYRSKTGFTKKYAEWMAEEMEADLFEASKIKAGDLAEYDSIIFGGGIYAGRIGGLKFIKNNLSRLDGKKVAVFATGGSSAKEGTINDIRNRNFSAEQMGKIRFFYLRGGMDYNRVRSLDRLLISMVRGFIKKKKEKTEEDMEFLKSFEKPVDYTDREKIQPIVSYIRG